MGIIGFLALIVLSLIASNVSDDYLLIKVRKLAVEAFEFNSTTEVSPVPSPVPAVGKSDSSFTKVRKPDNNNNNNNNNVSDSPPVNRTSKEKRKSSNYTGAGGPAAVKPSGKEKTNSKNVAQVETGEGCKHSTFSCTDKNKMIACIEGLKNEKMILQVQNEGNSILNVKLILPASGKNGATTVQLLANQSTKMEIRRSSKIVLDGGNGECVIRVAGPYWKVVTPTNGAYLMVLTVLVFGGIWCFWCNFRRRVRGRGGVAGYQEVEMGDENWDEVWDEDWGDDDGNGRSLSGNGLTSRSFNSKDGRNLE